MVELYPPSVQLENCTCPMGCAPSDERMLIGRDRLHGIPGDFNVVRCRTCGLMRTNPRPTAATIGVYYPANYGPYSEVASVSSIRQSRYPRLRRWLGFDARRLPPRRPGTLLEIGCASGAFLKFARAQGWSVKGIEFSESAAASARREGLDVQVASLEDASDQSKTFDVIAAWMVLEHLHHPVDGLRRLKSWLAKDGWLVASIPVHSALALKVFGSANYDLHLPNHLYHFRLSTLKKLLAAAGFQLEYATWQRNPNTLLRTLEYVAEDRSWSGLGRFARALRQGEAFKVPRFALAWLLGVTRTSGRIEFWARPIEGA